MDLHIHDFTSVHGTSHQGVIFFFISDAYNAVVMSGAFGEGHIPCEGSIELIRITKPGSQPCSNQFQLLDKILFRFIQ